MEMETDVWFTCFQFSFAGKKHIYSTEHSKLTSSAANFKTAVNGVLSGTLSL